MALCEFMSIIFFFLLFSQFMFMLLLLLLLLLLLIVMVFVVVVVVVVILSLSLSARASGESGEQGCAIDLRPRTSLLQQETNNGLLKFSELMATTVLP
jgi:Ca2+/Na+ antiporter